MDAIILAGGLGTRIRSILPDTPKSMARFNGIPFLQYQLDLLQRYSFSRFIICDGYLAYQIEDYFGDSYKNIPIVYSRETTLLGTGGAIKKAVETCKISNVFLLLNGDTYFDIPIDDFIGFHYREIVALSVALQNIKVENSYSISSGGIYLIDKVLFTKADLPDIFSLEKDFIPKATDFVQGKLFSQQCYDIGSPTGFILFRDYIENSKQIPTKD